MEQIQHQDGNISQFLWILHPLGCYQLAHLL